jgi:hypothetical protein
MLLNSGTEKSNCRVDIRPSTLAREQPFCNEGVKNVRTVFVQTWGIADMKQIGAGGCGCGLVSQVDRKIGEHSFDVVPHVHSDPVFTINECHTKIVMNLSSCGFDLSKLSILIVQPFVKLSIDFWVNVA